MGRFSWTLWLGIGGKFIPPGGGSSDFQSSLTLKWLSSNLTVKCTSFSHVPSNILKYSLDDLLPFFCYKKHIT